MADQWVRISRPGEEHALAVSAEVYERVYRPLGWIALHNEDFTPYVPPKPAATPKE